MSREITTATMTKIQPPIRVAFVVPHVFMGDALREKVIFSPGELARDFADADWQTLAESSGDGASIELTLFSPLPVQCSAKTAIADSSGFQEELAGRGYGYLELLKKHPSLFVAMSRQLQGEIIAKAFERANNDEFDVVHIYTNEEDQALIFAGLCHKPVVFTHHDPYNFLIKYKSVFPRYKHHNFVSMSMAQQKTAPEGTNFIANIYHGVRAEENLDKKKSDYFLYVGRVIEPKGVHLAVEAAEKAGIKLKIVGKRYEDDYFEREIQPHLGGDIEYLGFARGNKLKKLMSEAKALIMPSVFAEPFGMTAIEALAVGTPVIASRNGALPEIIEDGVSGFFADTVDEIVSAIKRIDEIDANNCVKRARENFSLEKMLAGHAKMWERLARGERGILDK